MHRGLWDWLNGMLSFSLCLILLWGCLVAQHCVISIQSNLYDNVLFNFCFQCAVITVMYCNKIIQYSHLKMAHYTNLNLVLLLLSQVLIWRTRNVKLVLHPKKYSLQFFSLPLLRKLEDTFFLIECSLCYIYLLKKM